LLGEKYISKLALYRSHCATVPDDSPEGRSGTGQTLPGHERGRFWHGSTNEVLNWTPLFEVSELSYETLVTIRRVYMHFVGFSAQEKEDAQAKDRSEANMGLEQTGCLFS
jgi:hypothetical protein